MWNGIYERWNPIQEFEGQRMYCDAVHHDFEGFRIWLRGEDPTKNPLIIRFENPLLYLNSDDSNRVAPISPPQDLKFPHAFWKVEDSELVALFHRSSCEIYKDWKIVHFAFQTCDDCVDVLSTTEPTMQQDS